MACVNRLPRLMAQQPIGLIIIDSVAGIFRLDSDAITRADNMRKLIHTIQMLQDEYECGVICVNQVRIFLRSKKSCLNYEFNLMFLIISGDSFNERYHAR